MKSRILLRITSCVLAAAIVFLAGGAFLFRLNCAIDLIPLESMAWLEHHRVPEFFINALYMLEQALTFLAPLVLGLFVFDRLAARPDGFTRCGTCGGILEHLARPQCPACRSRI